MSFTTAENKKRPAGGAYSRAAVTDRIVIAHSRRAPTIRYSANSINRVARAMIRRHDGGAARAAVERLNAMIDRGDGPGRDMWACVVHAIHELQDDADEEAGGAAAHQPTRFDLLWRPSRFLQAWRRRGGT
jgi:hypothetical protein